MKRVFWILLDSLGIGEMPDAAAYGDAGANTLRSVAATKALSVPNLIRLGLGNIDGVACLPAAEKPLAAHARIAECSSGKDTTVGHWELCGVISEHPFPTYENGFPPEIIDEFSKRTGRRVLCNRPYSGTEVIRDFGDRHMQTGDLIIYTSADSVFQIAAHEEVVPLSELYRCCEIARELLRGPYAVARVIARPFVGRLGSYTRTGNRRDFSLEPSGETLLDAVSSVGLSMIAVGKIADIFAGRGVGEHLKTHDNREGMEALLSLTERDFCGLAFANLVDFDAKYGHRRDALGYAEALSEFDAFLTDFLRRLRAEDLLIITADHGCDPAFMKSTDHTREYVPMLAFGDSISPVSLGTREGFADVGATVADYLGLSFRGAGISFLEKMTDEC